MCARWISVFFLAATSLVACSNSEPPAGADVLGPPVVAVPAPTDSALPLLEARPPATAPDRDTAVPVRPTERRIGALTQDTYIRAEPNPKSPEIGSLDIGGTALLLHGEASGTTGCPGGWYAVAPKGFICHDRTTTLEPDGHPLIEAKGLHAARLTEDAPYRWGESRYAPLYRRVPDAKEQRQSEGRVDKHLAALEKLREARRAGASEDEVRTPVNFRGVDIFPARGEAPTFLANGVPSPWAVVHTPADGRARYQMVPMRSTVAWTDEFFAEGRSWLLTPQLLLVPKDKVSLQTPSPYAGVHLGKDGQDLPLAFIRGEPKRKYRIEGGEVAAEEDEREEGVMPAAWVSGGEFSEDPDDSKGQFVATGETWERLAWVGLTGRARWKRGKRYLETKEEGNWIRESDAVVVRGREPEGLDLKEGEKWIDVSIHRGTLVAYEGRKAVFTTLISPGLKGYARVNGKPAKNTTPTGAFRIEWKHWTRTMSPDPEKQTYYLSEVPFTQFFHMPFALHGAYWHDDFGEPKSGGCVNLSVADARWLFGWTEPSLPEGWHSVRSGGGRGEGTWVVIR